MPVDAFPCFCLSRPSCPPPLSEEDGAVLRAEAEPCYAGSRAIKGRQVDPQHPDERVIHSAGELLARGGVVIYPTETYYGLGGHPGLLSAIERIYKIKGRAFTKPLPLIASDLEAVFRAAAEWPPVARRLAEVFWPGPLTLILDAASSLLPLLHAHSGKVAVRISSHPVAQALARAIGGLLTATSANQSGQRACRTPVEIPEELLVHVDGFLDAGTLGAGSVGLPSTIVDLSAAVPRLVRPGCIPWERVEEVLGAGC